MTIRPKFRYAVAAALAATVLGGGVAAAMSGTPEIDKANATMKLSPAERFTSASCAGEDGIKYVTFHGSWKGAETDVTPASTDYDLSGSLSIGKIVWTVNTRSKRGVLTGQAFLTEPASGLRTYAGTLRLITQGMPGTDGALVAGRGWVTAATYTKGAADGGSLLANVEMQVNASFAARGTFGDSAGTFNTPTFAVTTANQDC